MTNITLYTNHFLFLWKIELEEKLCLNEQLLSKMQGRENQVYGDDEMMKKKINQLQTNVDLLKGEKGI